MVKVKLLRSWNTRAGQHHPPEVIEVPAGQARRMAGAVPPYGEIVEDPVPVVEIAPVAEPVAEAKPDAKPRRAKA